MRERTRLVLLVCLLACGGCGKNKSTDELLVDVKGTDVGDQLKAVRLLQTQKGDPAKVVPTLTEALNNKAVNVRISAAIGLGSYGEQAKEAVLALQAMQRDRDGRVREAAGLALSRIDPDRFPPPAKTQEGRGK
jgi:HEAT repeat protein